MQTFLIYSSLKSFIDKEIAKIAKDLQVSPVNLIDVTPEKSIGIAEVRKISQTITLKPYAGGSRLIIIRDMEKATTEAGNAMLKILEEPPKDNIIILTTNNLNKLLPTIVSRCQVISNKKSELISFDSQNSKSLLLSILSASPGGRILLSQKLAASREEAIQLLGNLVLTLEELLHQPDDNIGLTLSETADLLSKVCSAKNYLERYINFKATLDILFLGFPKK